MRTSLLLGTWLATLAACGGVPDSKYGTTRAAAASSRTKDLDLPTREKLKHFEQVYRQHSNDSDPAADQQLAQLRSELCATPDSAFWLARLFVHDAVLALDEGRATDGDFVQVAVSPKHDLLDRAVGQLVAMGPNAVPCLRDDLLRHAYQDRRELGVRLLHAIGPAAVPVVVPLASENDPALRRVAVEALAGMQEEPVAQAAIEKALRDEHFAVRGAAYVALARAGEAALGRLVRALAEDADPYVRRTIAKELGKSADPSARPALLAYRARCVKERDSRSLEVADEALDTKGRK